MRHCCSALDSDIYHGNRSETSNSAFLLSSGDGTFTGDGGLAGDPLSTIRIVKRILTEKMQKAKEEDRLVEEVVCRRATQRLTEYEAIVEDLANRRSNALVYNKTEQAEKLRLAMIDSRDTVFRAIHVDLLLGPDELRAIGASSSWAP
ncbi:hypothetical protein COOONC_18522 [Cooperia oncophora]